MTDKYVPIFFDWPEATKELNAQEKGRLIDAIVLYARGGDWQEQIKGNERYLFPMFQLEIERRKEVTRARSEAGKEGGKQTQANASKAKQTQANASKLPNKDKDNDKDKHEHKDNDEAVVMSAHAREAAAAADRVMTFACNELQYMSPRALEELQTFRDDGLTDDVILYGLGAACDNGVRTWAYARSILNRYVQAGYKTVGEIKADEAKREAAKANMVSDGHGGKVANPALNYDQRSGDDFNAEITDDWMRDYLPKEGT